MRLQRLHHNPCFKIFFFFFRYSSIHDWPANWSNHFIFFPDSVLYTFVIHSRDIHPAIRPPFFHYFGPAGMTDYASVKLEIS